MQISNVCNFGHIALPKANSPSSYMVFAYKSRYCRRWKLWDNFEMFTAPFCFMLFVPRLFLYLLPNLRTVRDGILNILFIYS